MDKDVLTNILNRLEDKLDKVSTDLTRNTSETQAHTQALSDMKSVHDINAKIILETRDELKEVKNEVIKITSWKEGQTLKDVQVLADLKTLHGRIQPIEEDYLQRRNKKKETEDGVKKLKWGAMEKIAYAIVGAILISWRELINIIFKNI
jgi:seryl-tRNA synthetase